MINGSYEGV